MRVKYEKSFLRDLKAVRDKGIKNDLKRLIDFIKDVERPDLIPGLKKLKGVGNYYRIKLKSYRVGIKIEGNEVIFVRFLPRKEIYGYFPG